jgi:hypothetical protein
MSAGMKGSRCSVIFCKYANRESLDPVTPWFSSRLAIIGRDYLPCHRHWLRVDKELSVRTHRCACIMFKNHKWTATLQLKLEVKTWPTICQKACKVQLAILWISCWSGIIFSINITSFSFRNHLRKRFQISQRVYCKNFIKIGLTKLKLGFLPRVVLAVF